jgi:acetyl-CoA acetyltransferase
LKLAAAIATQALEARGLAPDVFDGLHLGTTVPSRHSFYGAPWTAAMLGAPELTGPTVSQACATSVRLLLGAACEVEAGAKSCLLAIAADRTSNGPLVVYPDPGAPGGTSDGERWVWDNFQADPSTGAAMVQTAENVATAHGFTTADQHEIVLLRHAQYQTALADDRAFQKRYMVTPVHTNGARHQPTVTGDEGVFPTTAEGLAALKPVLPGGTVTFGGQTHPADGSAGMVVTTRERARDLSAEAIEVRLVGFGEARVEPARMPEAPVPAARRALAAAGIVVDQVAAFCLHDPFAVTDLHFCRALAVDPTYVNRHGSSLIWGHPQAPTGLRGVIELIEELRLRGGGYGLFAGCSAGDSAAAVVVRVSDGRP